MNTTLRVISVGGLLLATLLLYTPFVPPLLSQLLCLSAFLGVGVLCVRDISKLRMHHRAALALTTLLVLYGGHLALHPDSAGFLRVPAYALSAVVLVVLLPEVVPKRSFLIALGVVGLLMSVLALLLAPFPTFRWKPGSGFVIKSIFQNPQSLGIIAVAGVWGLVPQTIRGKRRRVAAAGLVLCLVVIVLAENRSLLLGLTGGFTVIFAQRYRGALVSIPVVAIGAVGSLVVFGIVFDILPGPTALATYDLNNRVPLWIAAIEAVSQSPKALLFGYGAGNMSQLLEPYIVGRSPSGPHNGYLRMLLNTGVIGLIAYLRIQLDALNSLRTAVSINELTIVGLLVTFMVADLFGSITFFGFSTDTFLLAGATGYALRMTIDHDENAPSAAPSD